MNVDGDVCSLIGLDSSAGNLNELRSNMRVPPISVEVLVDKDDKIQTH